MKQYCVDLDVTFSKRMYVYADNEESAKAQAINLMNNDPYYHSRNGCWVSTEPTDCWIEDEE